MLRFANGVFVQSPNWMKRIEVLRAKIVKLNKLLQKNTVVKRVDWREMYKHLTSYNSFQQVPLLRKSGTAHQIIKDLADGNLKPVNNIITLKSVYARYWTPAYQRKAEKQRGCLGRIGNGGGRFGIDQFDYGRQTIYYALRKVAKLCGLEWHGIGNVGLEVAPSIQSSPLCLKLQEKIRKLQDTLQVMTIVSFSDVFRQFGASLHSKSLPKILLSDLATGKLKADNGLLTVSHVLMYCKKHGYYKESHNRYYEHNGASVMRELVYGALRKIGKLCGLPWHGKGNIGLCCTITDIQQERLAA